MNGDFYDVSVLYVGDADEKWLIFDRDTLELSGVSVNDHGKMPDLVVHMPDKNWIVLLEAASTHGPSTTSATSNSKGCSALAQQDSFSCPVFVSCFPDQATMKRYLTDTSRETDVWTADHPTHLTHFDGKRFLGPYND